MKARRDLTATELESLYERLDRRLDRVGLETQPKVAMRLLQLAQDPDAQLKDYGEAIKTDSTLTGRILRLANSAFYAQRTPVCRLDRALVLLGTDRTKAVCLGFYLARAAQAPGTRELAKLVWTQSVYRASLCMAMARSSCPQVAPEAFVIGLLLDSAVPLMPRLVGEPYFKLLQEHPNPSKRFAHEFETLEFTHVDTAVVLARRWKLPPLLARPLGWHHSPPSATPSTDDQSALHRIAFYAGAVQLDTAGMPAVMAPLPTLAERLFKLQGNEVEKIVRAASQEFRATISLFSEPSEGDNEFDGIIERVQHQLVEIMDQQMERAVHLETRGGPSRFAIAGQTVELEPARDGEVIAFISGSDGIRLISCTVDPRRETPESLCRRLGIDEVPQHELRELLQGLQCLAA